MPDLNPYYLMLSIPPEEQPPDCYRLLGVRRFEPSAEVIQEAALRQMAHVRTFSLGPYAAQSQKLLNELAQAKLLLLNPERRAEYDAQLRAAMAAVASSTIHPLARKSARFDWQLEEQHIITVREALAFLGWQTLAAAGQTLRMALVLPVSLFARWIVRRCLDPLRRLHWQPAMALTLLLLLGLIWEQRETSYLSESSLPTPVDLPPDVVNTPAPSGEDLLDPRLENQVVPPEPGGVPDPIIIQYAPADVAEDESPADIFALVRP